MCVGRTSGIVLEMVIVWCNSCVMTTPWLVVGLYPWHAMFYTSAFFCFPRLVSLCFPHQTTMNKWKWSFYEIMNVICISTHSILSIGETHCMFGQNGCPQVEASLFFFFFFQVPFLFLWKNVRAFSAWGCSVVGGGHWYTNEILFLLLLSRSRLIHLEKGRTGSREDFQREMHPFLCELCCFLSVFPSRSPFQVLVM